MVQNAEEFFRILYHLGLNFEAINQKFSQIVDNYVTYNLWNFQIDIIKIKAKTIKNAEDSIKIKA